MRRILFLFILIIVALPSFSEAQVTIRPLVMEETLQPRDAVTRDVLLRNTENRKIIVFATVNEITLGTDGEVMDFVAPVMSDRTNTVTSWFEVIRSRIELEPFEEKTVPVTFRIHPYAEAGEYYAFLGFVPTSKRPDAEATALRGEADGIVVNLNIDSGARESFSVSRLATSRVMLDPSEHLLEVTIVNDGDTVIVPEGEVIFYDSRGLEVGATDLNIEGSSLESGSTESFSVPVTVPASVGRYKASVLVANDSVSIQDTADFYVVPLLVLVLLAGLFIALITTTFILMRRQLPEHYAHEEGEHIPLFDNTGVQSKDTADHDITLEK